MLICSSDPQAWLNPVTLLTTGHDNPDGSGVQVDTFEEYYPDYASDLPSEKARLKQVVQIEAQYDEGDPKGFRILESGEMTRAMDIEGADGHLYFPTHKTCFELCQRFIDSRSESRDTFEMQPNEQISSIKQLWEILHHRHATSASKTELREPHKYYGGKQCRNVYWDERDGETPEEGPVSIAIPRKPHVYAF